MKTPKAYEAFGTAYLILRPNPESGIIIREGEVHIPVQPLPETFPLGFMSETFEAARDLGLPEAALEQAHVAARQAIEEVCAVTFLYQNSR